MSNRNAIGSIGTMVNEIIQSKAIKGFSKLQNKKEVRNQIKGVWLRISSFKNLKERFPKQPKILLSIKE